MCKVRRIPRVVVGVLSRAVVLLDERKASGMSLGAQSAGGDAIDSPLQRELAVALTSVREYARRVVDGEGG